MAEKIRIDAQTLEMAKMSLQLAHATLAPFDWQAWIDDCQNAHSVGHIIDPTAYRDALHSGRLESNEAFARAALTFLRTLDELVAKERR
jgi:hypothetical protein